jgi:hypothetical protein
MQDPSITAEITVKVMAEVFKEDLLLVGRFVIEK